MAFAKVSVSARLKPDQEPIELQAITRPDPKLKNRIEWSFEGREGDVFMVVLDGGGCFKSCSDGVYHCSVGKGRQVARIKTEEVRRREAADVKYSIVRVRKGVIMSRDPRIIIRE